MSRESTGSAPAPSIHTTRATPLPRPLPSRPVPLRAVRIPPLPPHSASPPAKLTYGVPPPSPACPPHHPRRSAHTAPAAPTKIKIRQSAFALLPSTPTHAAAFPPPGAPCTYPAPSSRAGATDQPSSSNPSQRVRAVA